MTDQIRKPNLFDLTGDMLELENILSNFDGDITDKEKEGQMEAVFAAWAENQDALEDKIDGYIAVMATFEARAEIRKNEAERLKGLATRDTSEFTRLHERLKIFLKLIKKEEFQTKFHTLSIGSVGGNQAITWALPAKDASEEEKLAFFDKLDVRYKTLMPEQTITIPAHYVLNTDAVREDLKLKKILPFAQLEPRKETLKIK